MNTLNKVLLSIIIIGLLLAACASSVSYQSSESQWEKIADGGLHRYYDLEYGVVCYAIYSNGGIAQGLSCVKP